MQYVWGERHPALRLSILVAFAILIIDGVNVDRWVDTPYLPWIATGTIFLVLSTCLLDKANLLRTFVLPFLALFLIVLVRSVERNHAETESISTLAGLSRPVRVTGIVDGDPTEKGSAWKYTFRVDSIWVSEHIGFPVRGRILVTSLLPGVQYGQRLRLTGAMRKPRSARNPGEFDYARYLSGQGIGGTLTINHTWQEQRGPLVEQASLFQMIRRRLYETNKKYFPPTEASIINAMLLGLRQDIPVEVREAYSNTGTIHILALSGLHTAFIIGMILGILGILRVPYRQQLLLGIAGLWFYVAVVDFIPSVTRAALMATIILLGQVLQKKPSVINSIFATLCLILIASPHELFDLGLQLSFLAVLAIVLIYPRLEARLERWVPSIGMWQGLPRKGLQLFLVSVAAQIGTAPLTMYYFQNLPLLAIVANLVVVPMSGLILGLDCLVLCSHWLSPVLAQWYANVNQFLTGSMVGVDKGAQSLPLASTHIWTFDIRHLVLCYAILGAALLWQYLNVRKVIIVAGFVTLCAWTWQQAFQVPELRVTFLDVGQGDACVVQFPDGKVMCIDAGDSKDGWNAGSQVILPYLKRQGIRQIDFLVLSHPHDDHVGGASSLLNEFEVRQIWHSGQYYRSEAVRTIDSITIARHIPSTGVHSGEFFAIDKRTRLYFLHPDPASVNVEDQAPYGTNNASVVMMMEFDQTRWLFMGDAEVHAIGALHRYQRFLDVDVMKVGHHGSWNGTTPELVNMTHPKFAVISCGAQNMFHHPSRVTLQLLSQSGAEICRTDQMGAIRFTSDGQRVEWMDPR